MNSYLVYRASFYLMLSVATLALSADTSESRFAQLYPVVVSLAGVVAFLTVDRQSRFALSRTMANGLALLTLGVLYFEYRFDDTQLIRSLGHWLVYLQLIKYFLPKTAEDDWFLFLLGLMQVLIGAVISQSDQIGMWLFAWAMLAIWVLGQFFLQREAGRFAPPGSVAGAAVLRADRVDPYAGLFDLPYAVATARVLATTLALGGLIFLILPRQAGAVRQQTGQPMARHLTGFDEEVTLGQFGEILENDTVVMTVEFTDEDGKTVEPPNEPMWRGVTMVRYEKGRWRRQTHRAAQAVVAFPDRGSRRQRLTRQKIKLEANDSPTLFAIRPIRNATARRVPPYFNPIDGTLARSDTRGGAYDYEVSSDPDPNAAQPHEQPPSLQQTEFLLAIPEALRVRLRAIAEPLVASVKGTGPDATTARARALEAYLRDSGQFAYSLHMEITDPSLDPIEDFLVNRKEGHCEYFASALTLLLRSIDIPARMVNGFKGGDWNELTQTMNVRQKHAHTWVEAYAGMRPGPERLPRWITLDPTPGAERRRSIAEVGGIAGNFRTLTDLFRHVWVFYIVGYDRDRQIRLLYGPMRQMMGWVKEKYTEMGRLLRRGFAVLFHFQDISAFISFRGFIVSFLVLVLIAGLAHLLYRLAHRLLLWLRGPEDDAMSLTAGSLFYRRLALLLGELELERTPAETQGEFAVRAAKFLTGHGPATRAVADVPQQVVDAFYRVRFGHLELEPASLEELDGRLDALEASLNHAE